MSSNKDDQIQPTDKDVVTVTADDVLQSVGTKETSAVRLGTYTQRAGLRLAAGVGALAAAVTLAIVVKVLCTLPAPVHVDAQMSKDQLDVLIAAHKQECEQVVGSATSLFDAMVVKVLLPVFTSILGYIFGARHASEK